MEFRCEMVRDGDSGRYHVEVWRTDDGTRLLTGPPRARREAARRAALTAVTAALVWIAYALGGATHPARHRRPR